MDVVLDSVFCAFEKEVVRKILRSNCEYCRRLTVGGELEVYECLDELLQECEEGNKRMRVLGRYVGTVFKGVYVCSEDVLRRSKARFWKLILESRQIFKRTYFQSLPHQALVFAHFSYFQLKLFFGWAINCCRCLFVVFRKSGCFFILGKFQGMRRPFSS